MYVLYSNIQRDVLLPLSRLKTVLNASTFDTVRNSWSCQPPLCQQARKKFKWSQLCLVPNEVKFCLNLLYPLVHELVLAQINTTLVVLSDCYCFCWKPKSSWNCIRYKSSRNAAAKPWFFASFGTLACFLTPQLSAAPRSLFFFCGLHQLTSQNHFLST